MAINPKVVVQSAAVVVESRPDTSVQVTVRVYIVQNRVK